MFVPKTNNFLKTRLFIGYINDYHWCMKRINVYSCLRGRNSFLNCVNDKEIHLCVTSSYNKQYVKRSSSYMQSNINFALLSTNKTFSTSTSPKDADVFGNLSYEKYEKVEMDEDEEAEEKMADTGVTPKWQKHPTNSYCNLIKMHLERKDLQLALNVLHVMKEDGHKPTSYIYGLLISAFSKQGDIRQCFKLFRKMKDRGFNIHPYVYNNLINACAESTNTTEALLRLELLRSYFYEAQVPLNKVHYTTLIKAYSRHNEIQKAFQTADEAKDKCIDMQDITAVLFHTAINSKQPDLKYALSLWHKMKLLGVKPNIYHYNCLIRAIRDTQIDDLKLNDLLLLESLNIKIQFSETEQSNLLHSPPRLNTMLVSSVECTNNNKLENRNSTNSKISISDVSTLSKDFKNIVKQHPLVLFGGFAKFLKQMESDNVLPTIKTMSLLLSLIPSTIDAENSLIKYIKEHNIGMDIIFFNILITRRSLRKKYLDAQVNN